PANHHISFFAVWQAIPAGEGDSSGDDKEDWDNNTWIPTVPKIVTPSSEPSSVAEPNPLVLHIYRQAAWNRLGFELPVDSVIANYARRHKLGRPVTNEFEINGHRVQGYNEAIVYMPVGQPHRISHFPW